MHALYTYLTLRQKKTLRRKPRNLKTFHYFCTMIQELQLRVLPQVAADSDNLRRHIAEEKGLALGALKGVRILKRSIDARQRTIYVNLKVRLYINEMPQDDEYVHTDYPDVSGRPWAC